MAEPGESFCLFPGGDSVAAISAPRTRCPLHKATPCATSIMLSEVINNEATSRKTNCFPSRFRHLQASSERFVYRTAAAKSALIDFTAPSRSSSQSADTSKKSAIFLSVNTSGKLWPFMYKLTVCGRIFIASASCFCVVCRSSIISRSLFENGLFSVLYAGSAFLDIAYSPILKSSLLLYLSKQYPFCLTSFLLSSIMITQ